MPLNSVSVLLVGRSLNAVKQSSVRYMATHRVIDLADTGTVDRAKPLADTQQKMITREKNTAVRPVEDFKPPGMDDLQDYMIKEQASGGYSAELQVYDHGKMISDNVVNVQLNKRSKRVFSWTK